MLFASLNTLQVPSDSFDGVELRLDLLSPFDENTLRDYMKRIKDPLMLTLRKGSEEQIQKLLSFQPSYFDLEHDRREEFLQNILKQHPKVKFVLSYHNFEEVPIDLEKIVESMKRYSVYGYKIAAMVHSTNDALRLLDFGRKHPDVSVICMGERGQFARILGPVFGNIIDYGSWGESTGPGQLSIGDLKTIYNYRGLNSKTQTYGLIGDPVESSEGHLYHNAVFKERNCNAVYVKMRVEAGELEAFFLFAKRLGFRGLSVTMPLKEKVIPYLDEMDKEAQKIGAVNTILFKEGKAIGFNTDGIAAIDVIEKRMPVCGKKVVIVGAGGAAKAIAYEAVRRGASVWIVNRTEVKARELAKSLGAEAGLPPAYDIVINCSSNPQPEHFFSEALAMDISYSPKETLFLKECAERGCQIIYGDEMFRAQAAAQTKIWQSA